MASIQALNGEHPATADAGNDPVVDRRRCADGIERDIHQAPDGSHYVVIDHQRIGWTGPTTGDAAPHDPADVVGASLVGADLAAVLRELRGIRTLLADQAAELLDAASTSRLLGISEASLYRLKSAGRLPAPIRLGGSASLTRWRREDLMAWLRAQRAAK
jgi:predicted DNA-binding transcriptional regulator AlpA